MSRLRVQQARVLCVVGLAIVVLPAPVKACPFCTAPKPTLSERREAADVVVLAQRVAKDDRAATLQIYQVLKGEPKLAGRTSLELPVSALLPGDGLLLAFGNPDPQRPQPLAWECLAVDETSYAYFLHAPPLRLPSAERLAYFLRYLESPDRTIADDVYAEFGRASFDAVRSIADRLPMAKLRGWMTDPQVPDQRQGLYGLMLGLATSAEDRSANERVLRRLIESPASDFRAGFDGVLGGYLLLAGDSGLDLIQTRLLANPQAARGDVLHAMTALRFYHEYGRKISGERLARAMSRLIARPEFAAPAIVDLARWQAWNYAVPIAALWQSADLDRPTQRAVIGYLLLCPGPEAARSLAAIRSTAAELVKQVEAGLSAPRGGR